MVTQTTKVKNGTITLPEKLRKRWREAKVFITGKKDTILIKRLTKPALTLKEMMDEFYQVTRKAKISKKDVDETIRSVRQEVYK